MSASSREDRAAWVQFLQGSIRDYPFHDIVMAKKAALRRMTVRVRQHQHLQVRVFLFSSTTYVHTKVPPKKDRVCI